MAKVVGDIAVAVGADVSALQAGMHRGSAAVRGFESDAARMGAKFAKVGLAVGAAAAAIGIGFVRSASAAAKSATEIQNLSRLSGVAATEFQKLAAAGDTVGFSQEKMADIFKDVNDKFGDFMATGAGPLADFFENIAPAIGVTAGQFARLSGPEALQLYVSSLERAGVSQQQMTFYMEALANDATALVPLLASNGREMKRLGDEAQRSGRILSDDMVSGGAELDRKMAELSSTIRTQFTAAILDNADEITALAETITEDWIPALVSVAKFIGDVISKMADFISFIGQGIQKLQEFKAASRESGEDMATAREDARTRRGNGTVDGNGFEMFDPRGDDVYNGKAPWLSPTRPKTHLLRSPSDPGALVNSAPPGVKKASGGSSGGADADDVEALRLSLATEAEALEIWRAEQLEKLREFREAKLLTEQEYNSLEAQVNEEHATRLADIQRAAMQQKLNAFSGALGDLSSLMQSENDKIFKIGKAAAIAQAVVDGYSAAVSAWDKGMKIGGPPVAAAFAGASLAKTGALVASIQSASPRGSGGAATGSAAGATSAPAAVSRSVVVQFDGGGDYINRKQAIRMIGAINEAIEDGAKIRVVA